MRRRVLSTALAFAALLVVAVPASAGPDLRGALDRPARSTVLVWGVGLFTTKAQFEPWLRAHGGQSFSSWRRQHPAATAILAAAAHPVEFQRSQMAPTRGPAPTPVVVSGVTAAREPLNWLLALLLVMAALLLAAAALPARLVTVARLAAALDDRRWLVGAAGSAILIGVAAAGLPH